MLTLFVGGLAALSALLSIKRLLVVLLVLGLVPVVLGEVVISPSTEILAVPGMVLGWYVDQLIALLEGFKEWLAGAIADALAEVNPL